MNNNLAYQEDFIEELLDGKVVAMSPRPAWNHVSVAGNIYKIFSVYLQGKKCTPIPDGLDLYLTAENRFVPDMMVVCDRDKIKEDGVHGAPDLVVEVLSPSTAKNDRGHKKDVYEKCKVKEYWIVDTASRSIEIYLLNNQKFILHDVYAVHPDFMLAQMTKAERAAVKTEFKCSLFEDLTIRLSDVFDRII